MRSTNDSILSRINRNQCLFPELTTARKPNKAFVSTLRPRSRTLVLSRRELGFSILGFVHVTPKSRPFTALVPPDNFPTLGEPHPHKQPGLITTRFNNFTIECKEARKKAECIYHPTRPKFVLYMYISSRVYPLLQTVFYY